MTTLCVRDVCPKSRRKIMVFSHTILNPCAKLELNWLRNKKVKENLRFDGRSALNSVLKLEMTSYSDNAYDVTNYFVVLESSWPILYSYQVSLLSDTKQQS